MFIVKVGEGVGVSFALVFDLSGVFSFFICKGGRLVFILLVLGGFREVFRLEEVGG